MFDYIYEYLIKLKYISNMNIGVMYSLHPKKGNLGADYFFE